MVNHEIIEPFIEHQGERRAFWLRKPRAIGDRLLIAANGSSVPGSRGNRKTILLDIRSAFGTGGHGTTEGCLVTLEKLVKGGETVLDVGTGSGILAIGAHGLGARHVTAVDISGVACAETRKNLALNGIEDGVTVIEGGIDSAPGRFDIVVANLRSPILADIMGQVVARREPGGFAIFSGILERELHPFLALLASHSVGPGEISRINGWMTVVAS